MKPIALALAALAMLLGMTSEAGAHALLEHASPEVGSTVHGSPSEVRLWFTEALEPAFCTVRVLDRNGMQVDKGDTEMDAKDHTLLRVSLPPLPAGTYTVVWRVLSIDTHVSEGDFTFDVLP